MVPQKGRPPYFGAAFFYGVTSTTFYGVTSTTSPPAAAASSAS
ncbi:MAG: hypothetical protein ACJA1E_001391 [Paracoccaceae bacterium]|jgi:hypothetical protein